MRYANAAQALVVGDSLAEGTAELWAWAVGPEDLSLSTLLDGPNATPCPQSPAIGRFVGSQAVTSPHLPAGTYTALVVDGRVYVARMHITAWELAGKTGTEEFYGSAEIDATGRVVRLFK